MKKTTLFFMVCLAFTSYMFSQTTSIPDTTFEQFLVDFGIDNDGLVNGQVATADISDETSLTITSGTYSAISDLTGIEAFTSLQTLNLGYNNLTSLNLTSNTALQAITCNTCSVLASVNVSGLVNVTDINFRKSNLSSLDVSSNTALETLSLEENDLFELDLSTNVALVSLNVKTNPNLTLLDMRNGNNANVTFFSGDQIGDNLTAMNEVMGTCVFVDDASATYLSSWDIDSDAHVIETEGECPSLTVENVTVTANNVNMYPNPANGKLFVSVATNALHIDIYNITGKRVITKALTKGTNELNISQLNSGVYLVRLQTPNHVITKKLMVE